MSARSIAWPEVALGDVCEFKYGKSLPKSKRAGGNVAVYGSNGVIGQHNKAITDGLTIVVGRKGSFGAVNLSHAPCWPIDTTYYIDRTATNVDLRWLAYQLTALGLTDLNKAADLGSSRGVAGQASPRPRSTQRPHPIPLPRPLRRSSDESAALANCPTRRRNLLSY